MPVHRPSTALTRRIVAWLIAIVLPLQAMSAGMAAVTGPLHSHRNASTRLLLDDLRRSPVVSTPREVHLQIAFGHFHGTSEPQRHRHAAGDASVVLDPSSLLAGDGDDAGTSPLLALLIGLIAAPTTWRIGAPDAPLAAHAAWSPQTHEPTFPERPPRAA